MDIIKERRKRVMVVEDDADINRLISYNLSRNGFDPEAAYDGRQAQEKLKREVFDVVVLDIMLPGVDGFHVCKAIKEDPAAFKTFVVMVTARVEPQDKIYANLVGADCYFTKPFNITELMQTVRDLADLRDRQYSVKPCINN